MAPKAVLECTYAIEQAGNVKTAPVGRNTGRNAQFSRWLARTKLDYIATRQWRVLQEARDLF